MPDKKHSLISSNLRLLDRGNWADRLESIEYLKSVESKEEVFAIYELAHEMGDFDNYHELIQVFEAIIKDTKESKDVRETSRWQGAFFGLFELAAFFEKQPYNLKRDYSEDIENTIEGLFSDLLGNNSLGASRSHKRPELVFTIAKIWPDCSNEARFLIVKKLIKYKVKELYDLVVEGLSYGDNKSNINILRVLIHTKEKRLIPALKKWLETDDLTKNIEAIRAMGNVGGVFELNYLRGFLNSPHESIRLEACLSMLKLMPFGRERLLKSYWTQESSLNNKKRVIQFLGHHNKDFSLRFLAFLLARDLDPKLEGDLIASLAKLRHPQKVVTLATYFKKASDDKKLIILMALKGRPYPELQPFYHQEITRLENPILKVLILESLGGFKNETNSLFLYRYLIDHADYTCSAAFKSLADINTTLACRFVHESLVKDNGGTTGLKRSFYKSIPLIYSELSLSKELRGLLRVGYREGNRNEKTLILRALPYLLDAGLFNLVVKDFLAREDETLLNLQGSAIIKCAFLKSSFVENLVPLMSDTRFVNIFKREKLKVKFCEALGFVLLQNHLLNSLFIQSIIESVLTVFLNRMEEFEIAGVIIFYLDLCHSYPHLVTQEHFEKVKVLFASRKNKPLKEAAIRFSLLKGDLESFYSFLTYHNSLEQLQGASRSLCFALGGNT